MSSIVRAPAGRLPRRLSLHFLRRVSPGFVALTAVTSLTSLLSACGGNSARSAVATPIGTTTGVALSTSTSTNQIQQGASFVIAASVGNDPNAQGVTWSLNPAGAPNGGGTLTPLTATTVTYTAPTGVPGTATPIVTATSKYDATQTASATLVVLGSPVLEAGTPFPANVGTTYATSLIVDGGLAPFTWTQTGTLPPGLTFGASTTAINSVSGTPTATGPYTFQVSVTDANGVTTAQTYTINVNAATACLLNGPYALLVTGFALNSYTVGAASLKVDSTGNVTGYQDYTFGTGTVAESLSGTCNTRTSNNGTLTIAGASVHSPNYDYAITASFADGRVQLTNGGANEAASGLLVKQDPMAFGLAQLAGSFAFGALGMQIDNTRVGFAGEFSIDATGAVTSGRMDSNATQALSAAALSGSMSAPDANGRGTLNLSAGGQTFVFSYYVVNVNKLLIVSAASPMSAPRLAGFATRQSGAFDNTAFGTPSILSLWGGSGTKPPPAYLALGRLSNGNAAAGTVDMQLDTASQRTGALASSIPGGSYAVAADGRSTMSFTASGVTRQFVAYLDGAANGYVIESGNVNGDAGLLEAQSTGPFSPSIPGLFVSGTQFPEDSGPIVLLPAVSFNAGVFSATYASGSYSLNTTSGYGVGSLNVTGAGNSVISLYIVTPKKIRVLRQGAISRSGAIEWLGS